jgi:hypothetical protein
MLYNHSLQQALQANEKNIADLIHQEINQYLLANFILENPTFATKIDSLYQQVYLNISQDLQNMLMNLIMEMNIEWEDINEQIIKQNIQLFVQELIQNKKKDLENKVKWLEKNK